MCGDDLDLIEGRPTGSVRVSLGYVSTYNDCQRFLTFITQCFLSTSHKQFPLVTMATSSDTGQTTDSINTKAPASTIPCNQGDISNHGNSSNQGEKSNHGDDVVTVPEDPCSSSTVIRSVDVRRGIHLTSICIYPVKSCGAMNVGASVLI